MKTSFLLAIGAMLSTSLLAQQVTNSPPSPPLETPAPASPAPAAPAPTAPPPAVAPVTPPAAEAKTNAPAAKSAKKKAKKKAEKKEVAKKKTAAKTAATAELKTVPLTPGPAIVAASHVNVRGQAKLKSEVVTRLTNGEPVTVIEEIVRNNSGPDEPSAWAKILLPPGGHVWANSAFLDTDKTVKANKLNVRSGPGENYSVLGQLQHGEAVKELATKGEWTEIEAPTNAYAFVAAQFLKQGAAATTAPPAIAAATPEVAPTNTTAVAEGPTIASTTTETPAPTNLTSEASALTNTNPPAETAATAPATPPAPEMPPPPRIVEHEGIVRGTFSIQAPTKFELVSPETRQPIDYLYTTSHDLDLRRYKGLRIIVKGEESLEERWGNTPVLTIQEIHVLSE